MLRFLESINQFVYEVIFRWVIRFIARRYENAYRETLWRRRAMKAIGAGHIITIPDPLTIQVEFQAPDTNFTFFDPPLQRQRSIMDLRFLTARQKKKTKSWTDEGKGSTAPLVVDGVDDVE